MLMAGESQDFGWSFASEHLLTTMGTLGYRFDSPDNPAIKPRIVVAFYDVSVEDPNETVKRIRNA